MLHNRTWKLLCLTIQVASVPGFLPYEMDGNKRRLKPVGKIRRIFYLIHFYIVLAITLFAICRLPKTIREKSHKFFDVFNHIFFIIFEVFMFINYLSNELYLTYIINFFNELSRLNEQGEKDTDFEKSPLTIRELFVWTLLPCGIFIAAFWSLIFVLSPNNFNYIFTLLPEENIVIYSNQFWAFALFELYFACSLLGSGVVLAAMQMSVFHSFLMWMNYIWYLQPLKKFNSHFLIYNLSHPTTSASKSLEEMSILVRRLQIMIGIIYNECFSRFFTPLCTIFIAFIGVFANFGTIHLLHKLDDISLYGNFYATGMSWGVAVYVFLFYTNAANFDYMSKSLIRKLTRKKMSDGKNEIVLRKTIKAIRPYAIWVGSFYSLKKTSSTVYISGLFNYTLSLLITYPP